MVVGYARVSTGSQSYEDQVAAAGEGRRRPAQRPACRFGMTQLERYKLT
jgi:hypothetical protein